MNQTSSTTSNNPWSCIMQIHEELDEAGNEIKAEAININDQLRNLQSSLKDHLEEGSDQESTAIPITTSEIMSPQDNPLKSSRTSPQRYDEISKRLEELVLLEEEYEKNKTKNQTSRVKFQGSGWSKGFLSSSSKKEKGGVGNNKEVNVEKNIDAQPKVPMTQVNQEGNVAGDVIPTKRVSRFKQERDGSRL